MLVSEIHFSLQIFIMDIYIIILWVTELNSHRCDTHLFKKIDIFQGDFANGHFLKSRFSIFLIEAKEKNELNSSSSILKQLLRARPVQS